MLSYVGATRHSTHTLCSQQPTFEATTHMKFFFFVCFLRKKIIKISIWQCDNKNLIIFVALPTESSIATWICILCSILLLYSISVCVHILVECILKLVCQSMCVFMDEICRELLRIFPWNSILRSSTEIQRFSKSLGKK